MMDRMVELVQEMVETLDLPDVAKEDIVDYTQALVDEGFHEDAIEANVVYMVRDTYDRNLNFGII